MCRWDVKKEKEACPFLNVKPVTWIQLRVFIHHIFPCLFPPSPFRVYLTTHVRSQRASLHSNFSPLFDSDRGKNTFLIDPGLSRLSWIIKLGKYYYHRSCPNKGHSKMIKYLFNQALELWGSWRQFWDLEKGLLVEGFFGSKTMHEH